MISSPLRTAEAFAIEDLIDPRETRPYLCQFIEALQPRLKTQLGPKYKAGLRPYIARGIGAKKRAHTRLGVRAESSIEAKTPRMNLLQD